MAMLQADFRTLLQKLKYSSGYDSKILKDISATIYSATQNDLQELLELLVSTVQTDIQLRVLSILSSYLLAKGFFNTSIIKYTPVYDTVQQMLLNSLPKRTIIPLNFILALLLSNENEEKDKGLVQYVQNMIRVRSCLSTLLEIFVERMMYQDTWVALCMCLAEICRGSEINQNYCSHLIPMCIQRCRDGMVDVCTFLQSLLQNNERNINIFMENSGVNIFERHLLQQTVGIQLLSAIVENSKKAVSILKDTDIVFCLRDFLRLYGPQSQLGQWSTLILFHIDISNNSVARNLIPSVNPAVNIDENKTRNTGIGYDTLETNALLGNKLIRRFNSKQAAIAQNHITTNMPKDVINLDDTGTLMRNVMKEMINWKTKTGDKYNNHLHTQTSNVIENINNEIPRDVDKKQMKTLENFTISFTNKGNDVMTRSFLNKTSFYETQTFRTEIFRDIDHNVNETEHHDLTFSLSDFKPTFKSTPKRRKRNHNISSKFPGLRRNKVQKRSKYIENSFRANTKPKNKSMTGRIFSAINESCTTFVKSVKNIFGRNKKNAETVTRTEKQFNSTNDSCSNSFTNYMRERDELLKSYATSADVSSTEKYKLDTCKTCRDTFILQEKMTTDTYLKETVKRLKFGIKLYGCNFKKICRVLWAKDAFVTPYVLNDLYRKLILNGGHGNHDFQRKAYELFGRKLHPKDKLKSS